MKKALFIAILLACLSVSTVQAQTFSSEQQATLDSLKQQLIDLLLQQIALLQQQLQTLIAQQSSQQTQIQTIVQNTTLQLGSASSTPNVGAPPVLTPTQKAMNKVDERKLACASLLVPGNDQVFVDWIARASEGEKEGYYDSWSYFERHPVNYFQSVYNNEIPRDNFCDGRVANYPQRAGCEKLTEIQAPYLMCVRNPLSL